MPTLLEVFDRQDVATREVQAVISAGLNRFSAIVGAGLLAFAGCVVYWAGRLEGDVANLNRRMNAIEVAIDRNRTETLAAIAELSKKLPAAPPAPRSPAPE